MAAVVGLGVSTQTRVVISNGEAPSPMSRVVRSCYTHYAYPADTLLPTAVQVKSRLQKMGPLASMNIFLRQEIDRMQRVITIVRLTLVDLKLAIEGTIIMSEVRLGGVVSYTCIVQR